MFACPVRKFLALGFALGACAARAHAAPTAADALKLAPVQRGVEYDYNAPNAEESALCTIKAEKLNGVTAWVVRGPNGAVVRQFSDSNSDNIVDTWSYFRNGLEVYRDIDANFNGKADQYRWFNIAGSRWGLDRNEDGAIDAWKLISPEEAAEEAAAALAARDARRFERLLLTKDDLATLGLAKDFADKLAGRVAEAPKTFAQLTAAGKIDAQAEFTDFGGLRPGMVPAGSSGLTKDLLVYEDAWAMIHSGDEHQQLQLGTMVNVDGAWKLVDGPSLGGGNNLALGFFYNAEGANSPNLAAAPINEPTAEMQKVLEKIEALDKRIAAAGAEQKPALCAQWADLLEKLAGLSANTAERDQWLKQLADMLSATASDGSYPDALERLKKLTAKLAESKADHDLLTHFQFRQMQTTYLKSLADPKTQGAKVQEQWLADLQKFVDEHKSSEHVGEALYQLATSSEFTGDYEAAQKWYQRMIDEFPNGPTTVKARGAVRRLGCVGKAISLKGPSLQGGAVDLSQYQGKIVAIHYWSSTAQTCEADHKALVELYRKLGGDKFEIIGVCLDSSRDDVAAYLKEHRLPWRQLYESGGFDSRLANEMGVISAPLIILVDQKGLGANANVQMAELEEEIKKLLPSRVASKK